MVVERAPQRSPVVVVARDDVDRHGKRRQQFAQPVVFSRRALLNQISGCEHQVGLWIPARNVADTTSQRRSGVDTRNALAGCGDMKIRYLGDQHGMRRRPTGSGGSGSTVPNPGFRMLPQRDVVGLAAAQERKLTHVNDAARDREFLGAELARGLLQLRPV